MKSYINDIRMVRGRISTNPFLEIGALKVNSTMSMPPCLVESISDRPRTIQTLQGDKICNMSVLNTTIKTNKLKLPKDAQKFLVVNPLTPLSISGEI